VRSVNKCMSGWDCCISGGMSTFRIGWRPRSGWVCCCISGGMSTLRIGLRHTSGRDAMSTLRIGWLIFFLEELEGFGTQGECGHLNLCLVFSLI